MRIYNQVTISLKMKHSDFGILFPKTDTQNHFYISLRFTVSLESSSSFSLGPTGTYFLTTTDLPSMPCLLSLSPLSLPSYLCPSGIPRAGTEKTQPIIGHCTFLWKKPNLQRSVLSILAAIFYYPQSSLALNSHQSQISPFQKSIFAFCLKTERAI